MQVIIVGHDDDDRRMWSIGGKMKVEVLEE